MGVFISAMYFKGVLMMSGSWICIRYSTKAIATPMTPGFKIILRGLSILRSPVMAYTPHDQLRILNTAT